MGTFWYLAISAFEIQRLLFPVTFPLIAGGMASAVFGLTRQNSGVAENHRRLCLAGLAQGAPAFAVLLYGAMEYHIVPTGAVSDDVAAIFIGGPLAIQVPLIPAWAWWCRQAWPISLGMGLTWAAYSLGAGFMARCAATGFWL